MVLHCNRWTGHLRFDEFPEGLKLDFSRINWKLTYRFSLFVVVSFIVNCSPRIPGSFQASWETCLESSSRPPTSSTWGSSYVWRLPAAENWHLQKRFLASWCLHPQTGPSGWFCCLLDQKPFQRWRLQFHLDSNSYCRQKRFSGTSSMPVLMWRTLLGWKLNCLL